MISDQTIIISLMLLNQTSAVFIETMCVIFSPTTKRVERLDPHRQKPILNLNYFRI